MANYFVVLEPMAFSQISAFETILAKLQTPVQRVLATTWFINSSLGDDDLYRLISAVALPRDRFLIIEASACEFDNLLISAETLDACWDATTPRP